MTYEYIAANDILLMRERLVKVDRKFSHDRRKARVVPVVSSGSGYKEVGRPRWYNRTSLLAEAFYYESVGPDVEPVPPAKAKRSAASAVSRKRTPEQIRRWQDQILGGVLNQADLAKALGVSPQRVSYLLLKESGREFRLLKQISRLTRQRKTDQEMAEAMDLRVEEIRGLRPELYRRRQTGVSSFRSGG